jgi:Raf kinase inhibitor-like YbhB/YbcL family protein
VNASRWAAVSIVPLLAATLVVGCNRTNAPTPAAKEATPVFSLTSPGFLADQSIPARFAMNGVPGGANVSIPYAWSDVPQATRSFALVLVDRAPIARDWVHWTVVDIPSEATGLAEGASGTSAMPLGARELANTYGSPGYGGPLPPPGSGRHPYEATIYALDVGSVQVTGAGSAVSLERAVEGHVLAKATLTGYFAR